ncbi:15187_t:CDS:2 [Acaulospora colombiana]|uniref:15187_t:CDS:1 n=1 Tax=Acaulospora colombiana TaxID=27376 RepID=A0ACA9LCN3_9GLOM|nr:15187_t:CDS:2 [Acaulospora colombiana]
MTEAEIDSLEHLDDADYWDYAISDEELQIPPYMIPPDPDDNDCLPSSVHISYPYGDPTRLTHPATQPNRVVDPNSRALYDEQGGIASVNTGLLWKDLALDLLLPHNPAKEEAARAAKARRLANGAQQTDGEESIQEAADEEGFI